MVLTLVSAIARGDELIASANSPNETQSLPTKLFTLQKFADY